MTFKIEISKADAPRIADWLANRGGVAIWESLDLSDAGARTFTPALTIDGIDTPRPSWRYADKPVEIVTQASDIGVYQEKLYKAFPVSLRRSSNGMMLKLTDNSQRKLDKHMQNCREKHGDAFWKKEVLPTKIASMGVFYSSSIEALQP